MDGQIFTLDPCTYFRICSSGLKKRIQKREPESPGTPCILYVSMIIIKVHFNVIFS